MAASSSVGMTRTAVELSGVLTAPSAPGNGFRILFRVQYDAEIFEVAAGAGPNRGGVFANAAP